MVKVNKSMNCFQNQDTLNHDKTHIYTFFSRKKKKEENLCIRI